MREDIRRAVAYAAATRIANRSPGSIYSFERRKHSHMSENFDYEARSHLSGVRSGSMYHYGARAHIQLTMKGKTFSGYDYESGSHFNGTVAGNRIQLYDYGEGRHFKFSV